MEVEKHFSIFKAALETVYRATESYSLYTVLLIETNFTEEKFQIVFWHLDLFMR